MEAYSLYQLNEYIRRVIALNFREPLWIEAEISQVKDSRGNHYLELIEKEGDNIIAQTSAVIWYRSFKFIEKKIGDLIYDILEDGTQVRLKCTVDYHERYGLKLVIEDIDPNYTYGQLELKRQEIINRLEEEGLMDLNKGLLIPSVVQKIAIISSSGAAGYQDFKKQLDNNSYGYTFKVDLYDSAVQGAKVAQDTTQAIADISAKKIKYDIVAIIRGGGSKLDLSGYDDYEISKSIALSEIPFVIGIGHDIDTTVTDMVACLSLKTPTAVADYIIEHNMEYEGRLESAIARIYHLSNQALVQQQNSLSSGLEILSHKVQVILQDQRGQLELIHQNLSHQIDTLLTNNNHTLHQALLKIDAVDPVRILANGYGLIEKEGTYINSVKKLKKNDHISITLRDGKRSGLITN